MNVAERLGRATSTLVVARCLGGFRLQDTSGNELQFRTRKARAILAILALNGRPMSRNALADLLWSDRGDTQARSSLRQTIFELQHLEWGGGLLLAAGREDVSSASGALVTDLELIRAASANGDWARLLTLLESSDSGLLTDLDGLDVELDDWLRLQRAHEPGKTISAAVDAAERCGDEAGPRAALDLVAEILRIDPVNEEATRLAMRLSHELGDRVGLHRHFTALRERLKADYDAQPSAETLQLFARLGKHYEPAVQAAKPTAEESPPPEVPPARTRLASRLAAIAAVGVLVLLAIAAFAFWRTENAASPNQSHVLVAVLPFDEEPPDADSKFLAAGLWEQTRSALTRSPSIGVLGPATISAATSEKLSPDQYRKRFGVTHLLEGTVRRSGTDLLVSVSLTRTNDGVAVWQQDFRGRMGEPFALQDSISSGIEGRLRAQLSPGGGRRAEEIATSPEVYGLYSEARQLIVTRDGAACRRAEALLRQALAADQNYAPAWALLGEAIYFNSKGAVDDSSGREKALAAVRHALSLAPRLASAHATLALVQGEQSAESEAPLRRAVALDPNYSEAWNWLGNSLASQSRLREAEEAYQHAVAIDPLLYPAIGNLTSTAIELGDQPALDRLVQAIAKAGANADTLTAVKAEQTYARGDFSGTIDLLSDPKLGVSGRPRGSLWDSWFKTLTALGYFDKLHGITGCPPWYAPLLEGKAPPPTTFRNKPVTAEEFWTSIFFSAPATRAMVSLGRSKDVVDLYRAGFRDADDFISRTGRYDMLGELAPNLAIALDRTGSKAEASYLLSAAAMRLEQSQKRTTRRGTMAQLAMLRGAQGDKAGALASLDRAIRMGWFPDGRAIALDLAKEPALKDLAPDPRFQAMRKGILDHVVRERAELGPLKV